MHKETKSNSTKVVRHPQPVKGPMQLWLEDMFGVKRPSTEPSKS
jgi:hypothetical protein